MGKKKAEDWSEQPLDIEYRVRIKTYGKPAKHIDQIGESLARLCQLNFTTSEVTRGKMVYGAPQWDEFAKDSGWVDTANDTGVTSQS